MTSTPKMQGDRNLLFGILALQMDFISRDALIAAMHAWVLDKSKPLGAILVEQGQLVAEVQSVLDALVAKHIEQHQGDPQQSLAALRMPPAVQRDLEDFADPEVNATLARLPAIAKSLAEATTLPYAQKEESSDGRFDILRRHAWGGLGEVYVARDRELHREVALKRLHERHADNKDNRARFLQEAEVTGGLEHPGIVPVYGLGTSSDGRPYYAMRFIRGQTFKQAIDQFYSGTPRSESERRIELRQLLTRFLAVCNAIEYAHSRGVIHRDIKPSNIMLGKYGETLVVDWGLAKPLGQRSEHAPPDEHTLIPSSGSGSSETLPGSAIGTPAYMSPEQSEGRVDDIGPASDVYSLGATFYSILTGKDPFESSIIGVILGKVQTGAFVPPRERNPAVPRALDAICLKAMSLLPQNRYPSCSALASDIEHWLADEPVTALKDPLSDRTIRWIKRHRVIAATSSALLAATVIGSLAGTAILSKANRDIQKANREIEEAAAEARSQRDAATEQRHVAELEKRRADASASQAKAEAEHANWLLYSRQLADAQREWEIGDRSAAWNQLNSCRKELRGWEYRYLDTLLSRHKTFTGSQGDITSVAFSPDGKWIVSGGGTHSQSGGRLAIWDAMSGRKILTLKQQIDYVTSVAFSPDGKRIASGSADKIVKVWDATSGKDLLTSRGHIGEVTSVAFSPDGKRLASGSRDKTVRVWSATNGQEMLTLKGHSDDVIAISFSPDGKRIVGGGGGAVRVWDAASGEEVLTLVVAGKLVHSLAFSPDGKRIVGAGKGLGSLKGSWFELWDATSGNVVESHGSGGSDKISSVAFSPDSKRIATGNGNAITVSAVPHVDRSDFVLAGRTGEITTVAFSPDGTRIASGARSTGPGDGGSINVWDLTNTPETFSFSGGSAVNTVAFSLDGKQVAVGSSQASMNGIVTVCDASNGTEILTLAGHKSGITSLAFSPDGKRIATGSSDMLRVWDAAKGTVRLTLKDVGGGALSPDGERIAGAAAPAKNGVIKAWDALNGRELLALKNSGPSFAMAFSPDGKQIAAVDVEKKIKVWDALSGKEKLSLKIGGGGSSLAFSPDGKWIAGGGLSGVIQIWNAARGQEILTLKRHMGYVTSVAFSRDGKRIASGSYDRTLRVWDAASGRELLTRSHRDYVTCVLFSPDSKRVASGGLDHTVRVWDAMSGQEVLVIRTGRDYVSRLAFSPDGQRIAIGCSSYSTTGITKVLNVESGQEILTLNGHTAAYSPDGKWIATGTGVYGGPGRNPLGQSIELWDATTGKSFLAVKDPGSGITDPIFSADGKRIASLSAGNTIKVWDATNGRTLLTLKGHATNVSCVAFSPDGNRLASGSREGAIKIWNATNGGQVLTLKLGGGLGHTYDYLTSVVFSPDGKRLIGGTYFEGVKIFDSSTGRELLNLGKDQLASVACSPDGSRIASGNIYGTIRLFDAASGREALILKAYQSSVNSLVFSVDGKRLASGSRDGVVKIWDASSSPEKLSQIETADQANSDAWNLATDPNTSLRDPRRAVELAQRAVGLAPLEGNYWNTLGVAEYRAGDWHSAETALRKSMSLRGGGDSADWFFLAMVTWNQGEKDRAHNWYRAARLWMTRSSPNEELQRFRSEAAALLGLPVRISSEPDDSAALVDVLAEAKPASSSSYFARGQVFADLGQWDRADADFTKAIETGEKDVEAWSMRALVRLAENDQPGFRAACQAMLDQFAKTTDAQTASSVARTCSLAPDAISDFGPAIALAQRAVGDQPLWHEYSQGLGAILYRAGQFEKSVRQLRDLEDLREFEPRLTARAYTAFFLAMAEHRLRHPAEAKKWLAKARDAMANSPQSRGNRGRHSSWAGNLTMKILRHEAEALIENASSPDREMRK